MNSFVIVIAWVLNQIWRVMYVSVFSVCTMPCNQMNARAAVTFLNFEGYGHIVLRSVFGLARTLLLKEKLILQNFPKPQSLIVYFGLVCSLSFIFWSNISPYLLPTTYVNLMAVNIRPGVDLATDHGPDIIRYTAVFAVFATVAVIGRIVSRRIQKAKWNASDFMIGLGLVGCWAETATVMASMIRCSLNAKEVFCQSFDLLTGSFRYLLRIWETHRDGTLGQQTQDTTGAYSTTCNSRRC